MNMQQDKTFDQAVERDEDACQVTVVHQEAVAKARQAMLGAGEAQDLAEVFKVLGDPTRARILSGLSSGELCVCDLASLLDVTQSAVSHQLRVLRSARMVKARREGKMVFYSLDDDHVALLFAQALEHVREG